MRGPESENSHARRVAEGFYDKYLSGNGLDIGFRGATPNAEPVLPTAIGVDFDYPGYDGKHLPFENGSQDYVYNSHCLEHIHDFRSAIREWFRVLKTGGFLVIAVPHIHLYEKRDRLPSIFNLDHKRTYTPSTLAREIEHSLEPNTYRIRSLRDCDFGFDYSKGPEQHSQGEYQVELVVEKIVPPQWKIAHISWAHSCLLHARNAAYMNSPEWLRKRIKGTLRSIGLMR